MDNATLEILTHLSNTIIKADQKKSLDALFILFRKICIFDNLAVYVNEGRNNISEVVFAQAAGRGRNKESEASWGEDIANQVISKEEIVKFIPEDQSSNDRTASPFLLGLPMNIGDQHGALVFIRFGGPEFTADQLPLAMLASVQTARIIEQHILQEHLSQLEHARHRAQLQDDFIATISHELRTPLGFIKGYATSLLRSDTKWDDATQQEFLTIIDEESDHLVTLIDRMLDSARLQSGNMSMDFQLVRLDSLIRDVVQHIHGRRDDVIVEMALAPSVPILADSVRLAQVFENLFDNAIKYAPGTKISISLQDKDDWQIVTFADQGPGIPTEHIAFLFERFYRVPGQLSKIGTGLGLFICRQIINAHKGRISVNTSLGKGTTFQIELPVQGKEVEKEE
jgi:signal transduction histidine kinase